VKIETILDQIDLGAMALPEFQRGYVWNRDQVRGLMYSLYRKHPVGSLLVWVTKTENADARGDQTLTPGSVKLLLDGQQRITSLYGLMRGKSLFSAMKDIDSATFKSGLESTEKVVDRILNLIASRLGLDHDRVLGSRYSVPLMSRYLQQRGGKLTNQSERDQLLYWYVHTMLWGRYSASTESVLATDLEAITAAGASGPGDALKRIIENLRRERSNLKLNESDFAGSSKGNRFYWRSE